MEIVPELPVWGPPNPPNFLPGDEPFVLFAMDSMISRLEMDPAAIKRVIGYLSQKYSVDEANDSGWSNYHILAARENQTSTAMRGGVAGE
jgi:hypothetical protein